MKAVCPCCGDRYLCTCGATSGWQPIESVPRDGRPVLVYLEAERLKSRVHGAFFRPNVAVVGGVFEFDMPKATHWMPMPEPPQ